MKGLSGVTGNCHAPFLWEGVAARSLPYPATQRLAEKHSNSDCPHDGASELVRPPPPPLKLIMPVSLLFFFTELSYYIHTFLIFGRFTSMSALLLSVAVIFFLIELVSGKITTLMYKMTIMFSLAIISVSHSTQLPSKTCNCD